MSISSSSLDLKVEADRSAAAPAWKHELNERLAAMRARHTRRTLTAAMGEATPSTLKNFEAKAESRAARLAAKVAERYSKAPSYSELLAAEAHNAALAAEAAATAARQASDAAQALLAGMDEPERETPQSSQRPLSRDERGHELVTSAPANDVDAVEAALVLPAQPLPVNLIEFPRELVAARRARPRLEEGPLRESEAANDHSQLRIFEVEPESISKTVKIETSSPGWSSIRLDAKPISMPADEENSSSLETPLKAAPLEDRFMSWIFDAGLVLFAFLVFVLVFAACTAHPPSGKPAILAAGLVFTGLFLLYQYVFFRFTESTPGMRYAKIALCTFDDDNPTRKAMRRRILFMVLSAAPLGLGFAWAWFDADRLGWHDRLTRMYQRSYR